MLRECFEGPDWADSPSVESFLGFELGRIAAILLGGRGNDGSEDDDDDDFVGVESARLITPCNECCSRSVRLLWFSIETTDGPNARLGCQSFGTRSLVTFPFPKSQPFQRRAERRMPIMELWSSTLRARSRSSCVGTYSAGVVGYVRRLGV